MRCVAVGAETIGRQADGCPRAGAPTSVIHTLTLYALAVAPILCFAMVVPIMRLDFWWHLKIGEVIATTGTIPRYDTFSYTAPGELYINQSWLGDLSYFLLYRAGGLALVLTANAVLFAAAFAVLMTLLWQTTGELTLAAGLTLAAEIVAWRFAGARPQTYGILLFAAVLTVLELYRQRRRDALWLIPPLAAVWANLHGTFILILPLVGIYGLLGITLSPPRLTRAGLRLAIVGAATIVATCLTPEGPGVYAYVARVQSNPAVQSFISEWKPPDIKSVADLPFFLLLFATLFTMVYARPTRQAAAEPDPAISAYIAPAAVPDMTPNRRRPDLIDIVLVLVFACLALSALRNVVWFAFVAPLVIARTVADGLRVETAKVVQRRPRAILDAAVLLVLGVLVVVTSPWVRPRFALSPSSYGLVDPKTPIQAVDFIADHHLDGRIFHLQVYGDYLMWRLGPQQKVFLDGRTHLYSSQVWDDYFRIGHATDDWPMLLRKYDVHYLLLARNDPLDDHLLQAAAKSPDWALLYQDDLSMLYELRGG